MVDRLVVAGGLVLLPSFEAEARDLVIEGGTIVDVVAPGAGPADAARIDARDRAVVPGLVNAHVHGHGTLAKGLVEDRWPLELYLNALPALAGGRTSADMALNGLLGAVELIRKGCTTACDLFTEFPAPTREGIEAVAGAYRAAGLRAVVAPMVADHTLYGSYPDLVAAIPEAGLRAEALSIPAAGAAALDGVAALLTAWPFDRDLVRPGLAPSIPTHCGDDFLVRCRDLARDNGLVLHTHLAESKAQAVAGLARYGRTLTAHLDALGLLAPNFAAVHAVWLDDDDVRRLADRGASAVHAPTSNLRFGSGLAPVRRMLEAGVNVALATDAANASDSLNMFEALRAAAGASTLTLRDHRRWLGTDDVLRMATQGGARALGFGDRVGRVAPGCKADLVLLDLGHINYVPLGNLARQVTFTENGAAVDSVLIDGRLVLDRGRVTTVDEAKLRRDAQAAADRLRAANGPARALARRLEPAVSAFCRDFACRPYPVNRFGCDPA